MAGDRRQPVDKRLAGEKARGARTDRAAQARGPRQGGGPPQPRRSARDIAAVVLHRVCHEGAFAMRALDAELSRANLAPRDASLCTEIVYGALRVLPALDALLAQRLEKGLAVTDPLTLATLRVAAYQLQHLSRVPTHGIVNEAVAFVRAKRSPKSAGFVNAVLRRLAENRPAQPEPPDRVVLPPWLAESLVRSLGEHRAALFSGPRPLPPPLCLSTRPGERDAVLAELRAALPEGELLPGALSPQAILARRVGDPRRLPGYERGRFWVQEEGAQLVALAVQARGGQRVADLCAGHGGKSLLLGSALSEDGALTAIDIDERKLDQLRQEWQRLGLPEAGLAVEALDLSVGLGGLAATYDRVLVDAPCSGLGTLHRRPELLLRVNAADPGRFAELQIRIAVRAAELVREDGELFIAVCSPLAEEGSAVADAVQSKLPHTRRLNAGLPALGIPADPDHILRIGPWSGPPGTFPDAYQVIRLGLGARPASSM